MPEPLGSLLLFIHLKTIVRSLTPHWLDARLYQSKRHLSLDWSFFAVFGRLLGFGLESDSLGPGKLVTTAASLLSSFVCQFRRAFRSAIDKIAKLGEFAALISDRNVFFRW